MKATLRRCNCYTPRCPWIPSSPLRVTALFRVAFRMLTLQTPWPMNADSLVHTFASWHANSWRRDDEKCKPSVGFACFPPILEWLFWYACEYFWEWISVHHSWRLKLVWFHIFGIFLCIAFFKQEDPLVTLCCTTRWACSIFVPWCTECCSPWVPTSCPACAFRPSARMRKSSGSGVLKKQKKILKKMGNAAPSKPIGHPF